MNVELVAQMFKNYQSNVLFHLEGMADALPSQPGANFSFLQFHANTRHLPSHGQPEGALMKWRERIRPELDRAGAIWDA